eukprot:COSAG02_NODE_17559_length_995_cov_0.975446_1_plen_284_part_01
MEGDGDGSPLRFRPLNREGTWADSGHFVLRGAQKYAVLTPDGKPLSVSPARSPAPEHAQWSATLAQAQQERDEAARRLAEEKQAHAATRHRLEVKFTEAIQHTDQMLVLHAAHEKLQRKCEEARIMAAEQEREATLQTSRNAALLRENERLEGEVKKLTTELAWFRAQRSAANIDSATTPGILPTPQWQPPADHLDMVNLTLAMSDMVMASVGRPSMQPARESSGWQLNSSTADNHVMEQRTPRSEPEPEPERQQQQQPQPKLEPEPEPEPEPQPQPQPQPQPE